METPLTPLEFALIGLVFALIGMIFTALSPSIDYFSYFFTLFIMPLFLFSGTFFPVERLPAATQQRKPLTRLRLRRHCRAASPAQRRRRWSPRAGHATAG